MGGLIDSSTVPLRFYEGSLRVLQGLYELAYGFFFRVRALLIDLIRFLGDMYSI